MCPTEPVCPTEVNTTAFSHQKVLKISFDSGVNDDGGDNEYTDDDDHR